MLISFVKGPGAYVTIRIVSPERPRYLVQKENVLSINGVCPLLIPASNRRQVLSFPGTLNICSFLQFLKYYSIELEITLTPGPLLSPASAN